MALRLIGVNLPDNITYPNLFDFELSGAISEDPIITADKSAALGSYYLGKLTADVKHNFANTSKPLTVIKNPQITDGSVIGTNLGYYDTGISLSGLVSPYIAMSALVSVSDATKGSIFGNFYRDPANANATTGFVVAKTDTQIYINIGGGGAAKVVAINIPASALSSGYLPVVAVIKSTGVTLGVWDSSSGAISTSSIDLGASITGLDRTILIGGSYSQNDNAASNVKVYSVNFVQGDSSAFIASCKFLNDTYAQTILE